MYGSLKRWKAVDVFGQIILLALPFLLGMIVSVLPALNVFQKQFVFSLGGWQLLSFMIHLNITHTGWKARGRRIYTLLLVSLVFLGLVLLVTGLWYSLIAILIYLLAWKAMTLLYLTVSFFEWRTLAAPKNS